MVKFYFVFFFSLLEGSLQYPNDDSEEDSSDEAASPLSSQSRTWSSKSRNATIPAPSPGDMIQKLKQQQASISCALSAASVVTTATASQGAKTSTFTTSSQMLHSSASLGSPPMTFSTKTTSGGGKAPRSKKTTKFKASMNKNKTIKFHEYKGPPSVNKNNKDAGDNTQYHMMLQQQQLFLQWQLELKKNPNIASMPYVMSGQKLITSGTDLSSRIPQLIAHTPGSGKTTLVAEQLQKTPVLNTTGVPVGKLTAMKQPQGIIQQKVLTRPPPGSFTIHKHIPHQIVPTMQTSGKSVHVQVGPPAPPPPPPLPTHTKTTSKAKCLEEMKVAELRVELKKHSLTVSGSKPQLIERLRPYADSIFCQNAVSSSGNSNTNNSRAAYISTPSPSHSSIGGPPSNNPSLASSLTSPGSVSSVCNAGVINIQPISPSYTDSMIASPPTSPMSSISSTITAVAANSSAVLSNAHGATSSLELSGSFGSLSSVVSNSYSPSDNSMDVPSPTTIAPTAMVVSQKDYQSMIIDQQSRPPSTAPMEIEQQTNSPPVPPPLPQPGMHKKKNQISIPQVLIPMATMISPNQQTLIGQPAVQNIVPATNLLNTATQQLYTTTTTTDPQLIEQSRQQQQVEINDDADLLVRQTKLQIEELERKLQQSRLELQQAQQQAHKQKLTKTPSGKEQQQTVIRTVIQDGTHHIPLTQPTPLMSQIPPHIPIISTHTSMALKPSLIMTQNTVASTKSFTGALSSQSHLFIQPSNKYVASNSLSPCTITSASVKQTLANFLLQNGGAHKAQNVSSPSTSVTYTTTTSSKKKNKAAKAVEVVNV